MAIKHIYDRAAEHFNKTKKPPRSKNYTENERPLRRVNEPFLKLVKEPHSYVYRFCGHDAVRAYEPDENGNYQVCVINDGYQSTSQYMYTYTGIVDKGTLETTDGRIVRTIFNWNFKRQDKDFSAVLMFNPEGKLIVEQSWHADIYKKQSNDSDKEARKEVKAKVNDLVTLQMFKMPSFRANVNASSRLGQPFRGANININDQLILHKGLTTGSTDTEMFIAAFDELAQATFDTIVSKRIYNEFGYKGFYSSWTAQHNPNHAQEILDIKNRITDEVTTEDMRTVLERKVLSLVNLNQGSDYVALPQFAESLPTKYYLTNK